MVRVGHHHVLSRSFGAAPRKYHQPRKGITKREQKQENVLTLVVVLLVRSIVDLIRLLILNSHRHDLHGFPVVS